MKDRYESFHNDEDDPEDNQSFYESVREKILREDAKLFARCMQEIDDITATRVPLGGHEAVDEEWGLNVGNDPEFGLFAECSKFPIDGTGPGFIFFFRSTTTFYTEDGTPLENKHELLIRRHTDPASQEGIQKLKDQGLPTVEFRTGYTLFGFDDKGNASKIITLPVALHDPRPFAKGHYDEIDLEQRGYPEAIYRYHEVPLEANDYELVGFVLIPLHKKIKEHFESSE